MQTTTAEGSIREFIARNFMYREGVGTLGDEDSLLDRGLIDSTGVLELVMFLEKSFDIKVQDDEVVPENLDSITRIASFVRRKVSATAVARVA